MQPDVPRLDALRDWAACMRERTCRQFDRSGSTPAGWHVLLPDGEFGFLDVRLPQSAEEHAELVQRARAYMRAMNVRACLFAGERELADGRPALLLQYEAVDARGQRQRSTAFVRIAAAPAGRRAIPEETLVPTQGPDIELATHGLFPDLLPEPPSPLRIL